MQCQPGPFNSRAKASWSLELWACGSGTPQVKRSSGLPAHKHVRILCAGKELRPEDKLRSVNAVDPYLDSWPGVGSLV